MRLDRSMRVVSLCPSITDTVFALGRGDTLVGRTKFCVQPRGEVERVERVGGTKNPHVDRIVELAPDVVLMNEEENRREDAEALQQRGVRVVSSFARDVEGAIASVRQLGDVLDVEDDADALAARIQARFADVRKNAALRTFAYLIWRDPLMAAGPGTYVDALLSAGGGVNVVNGDRYPEVNVETLRRAERVLLSSEPFPFAAKHLDELAIEIPRDRLKLVDGERLSWHGAKTLEGLAYVQEALG